MTAKLKVGGLTFPLAPQPVGKSLLPVADPWLAKAIDYWAFCIRKNTGQAYVAAMSGQALGSDTSVMSTAPIDLIPFLDVIVARPPLLCVYPASGSFERTTLERSSDIRKYKLAYVLPGMSYEKCSVVNPLLQATWDLLMAVTEMQSDPDYVAGEKVWTASGTRHVKLTSYEIGYYDAKAEGHLTPALTGEIEVALQTTWVNPAAPALTYMLADIGIGNDITGILDAAISMRTDIGLRPNRPALVEAAASRRRSTGARAERQPDPRHTAPRRLEEAP